MNERIQELAEQANLITHKVPNGLAHLHTEQDVEKFAELIVRECANIAAKNQAEDMNWDISEIIKEHFGVENEG